MSRASAELVDAGLHVVARLALPCADRLEVDVVDRNLLVSLDDAVGYLDAEVALGTEYGEPQPALRDDLALG